MKNNIIYLGLFLFLFTGCKPGDENGIKPGGVVIKPGMNLYGVISDQNGNPVRGIVVSDGFQCVTSDGDGVYQMKHHDNATHVYYSIPSEYEVNVSTDGYPDFFAKIKKTSQPFRSDFSLKKLPAPEKNFNLICIGDPQVTAGSVEYFRSETMADIHEFVNASTLPCYAIVVGDVTADTPAAFATMRGELCLPGMKPFVTIGNHDKVASGGATVPRDGDRFADTFGPLNYSFDRGDVHFVCMDNVRFTNASDYQAGFTDEQVAWLGSDLSFVPKDKMIVLFYHIPIRGASARNMGRVLDILKEYREVHLMAGHTHYADNYIDTSRGDMYEHIHGASCGMWWSSDLNGCGSPNCYYVYEISGAAITDGYLKGTHHDRDFQIRMHRGSDVSGGDYEMFSYSSLEAGFDSGTVIANVFNADNKFWKVELYEDGVNMGKMKQLGITDDMWTLGYHIGYLGKGQTTSNRNLYTNNNRHLFYKQVTNPGATVKVVATDQWNNRYEQDVFTEPLDFSGAVARHP